MSSGQSVQYFEQNAKGRDFVVGDIHGAFAALDMALKRVKFDPARDRLFSVGDLVDRGRESDRCLEYLNQPWFHAVRGNHEHIFLKIFDGKKYNEQAYAENMHNGVSWIAFTPEEKLRKIHAAVSELPVAIEVRTARGTVGIVHADVPAGMSWPEFTRKVRDGDKKTVRTALWGRDRVDENRQEAIAGIDRVFAGHTPHEDAPRRFGNFYDIDTGAAFRQIDGERPNRKMFLTLANIAAPAEELLKPFPGNLSSRVCDPPLPDRPFRIYGEPAAAGAYP